MAKRNSKTKKNPKVKSGFFKRHRKSIIIVLAVWVVLMLAGGGLLIYRAEMEKKAVEDAIASCIDETKKNPLGFISECYEKNDREIPVDVRDTDKARVDRILAQETYDLCMTNASFSYDYLWDMNDINRLNGKSDSSYRAEYVQDVYEQRVEECKVSSPLSSAYEAGFKTGYRKEFIGWKEPRNYTTISENMPLLNRYNANGKIEEGSNMPADQEVPDSVRTVGGVIAQNFKDAHLDWWY